MEPKVRVIAPQELMPQLLQLLQEAQFVPLVTGNKAAQERGYGPLQTGKRQLYPAPHLSLP